MTDYTVSCELPEICDPGDYQDREATPVEAVEEFCSAICGNRDHWVYVVRENSGQKRTFQVDMASGPSVTEVTT